MILSDNTYKPKVSIIIPVYNVKQYLSEALDSVINQTYKNLEIIVVDDGSNDGSEIICEEYAKKDERIKLIHRENGGLSAARNTGLDNVTGEYVAFLDSDDIFLPEAIETALKSLISYDVDCVSFRYILCKIKNNINFDKLPKGQIIPNISKGKYSRREALKAIANQNLDVMIWTKLTKQNIWDNIRFPENHVYEDLYLIPQIFNRIKNIYVEDNILVLYRKREESITTTNTIKNIRDFWDSWTVFKNFIEIHTPDIFDSEQIQKIQKTILTTFIFRYVKVLSMQLPDSEVINLFNEIIDKLEKSVKIKNCNMELRFLYYMIFNHPKLLSIFYPSCRIVYRCIKDFFRIIIQ